MPKRFFGDIEEESKQVFKMTEYKHKSKNQIEVSSDNNNRTVYADDRC